MHERDAYKHANPTPPPPPPCPQLMFVLRGGLSRGQFGLLNEGLYQHAYSGTKKIVERYLEVRATNSYSRASLCLSLSCHFLCV